VEDDTSSGVSNVKGPWSRAKIIDPNETDRVTEDMVFIDDVSESIMIPAIHNLAENGVDIKDGDFIAEIGFLNEVIKSIMYRSLNYQHPIHQLIDSMMKVETENPLQTYAKFDYEMLGKVIQTTYNEKDDSGDEPA
jgi:hypothetical protein